MAEQGIGGLARREETQATKGVDLNSTRISGRPIASFSNRESNAIAADGRDAQRSINQLAKLGGEYFSQENEKQKEDDAITGVMWAAENGTLAQLRANGASTATVESFAAANGYKKLQEHELKYNASMKEDAKLTPGQYAAKVKQDVAKLSEGMGKKGKLAFLQQYMASSAKLAAKQSVAHNGYMVGKYKQEMRDAITLSSANGNTKHVAEFLKGIKDDDNVGNLNQQDRMDLVVDSVAKAFDNDDRKVWDTLNDMKEFQGLPITGAQNRRMLQAKKSFDARQERVFSEKLMTDLEAFDARAQAKAASGAWNPSDYVLEWKAIQDKHGMTVGNADIVRKMNEYKRLESSTQNEIERRSAREERAKLKARKEHYKALENSPQGRILLTDLATNRSTVASMFIAHQLNPEQNAKPDLAMVIAMDKKAYADRGMGALWNKDPKAFEEATKAWASNQGKALTNLATEGRKLLKAQMEREDLQVALNSGSLHTLSPEKQQKALRMDKERIAKEAAGMAEQATTPEGKERAQVYQATETMKQWNRYGIVDKDMVAGINSALNGSVMTRDELKLTDSARSTMSMMQQMSGVNEALFLQHLKSPKAKEFFAMVQASQGQEALMLSQLSAKNQSQTAKASAEERLDTIDKDDFREGIADVVDDRIDTWFTDKNGFSSQERDRLRTDAGPGMEASIKLNASKYLAADPTINMDVAISMATNDELGSHSAIGGKWIKNKAGVSTPIQQMGITVDAKDGINHAHAAVQDYIREAIEGGQWRGQMENNGVWQKTKELMSGFGYGPLALFGLGDEQNDQRTRGVPRMIVSGRADGLGVKVQPRFADGTTGTAIDVLYKDAGNAYRRRRALDR